MDDTDGAEVRSPQGHEATRAALAADLHVPPGTSPLSPGLLQANAANQVVASRGRETVGHCVFVPSAGRCAVVLPPRLRDWDPALAARLIRGAVAQARGVARLIQCFTEPDGAGALAEALGRAGLERLAVLIYMRRAVGPGDAHLAPGPDLVWRHYSAFRHRLFVRAIRQTYDNSLDCPGLAGLRTVDDVLATHKHTGSFMPRAWHVALADREPVGVELVNNLEGRGELVYLGVSAAARARGLGKVLLSRAIRDTAAMGLPKMGLAVDAGNEPALRLYRRMGFQELRRRLAWFVPAERLGEFVL